MLYPIVFIIGFLLSGIWFSFHIYVSQKLKNTKKALMFSPLLTAIIPTIIIWLLMGDYPFHFEKLIDYKVWVIAAVTLVATCAMVMFGSRTKEAYKPTELIGMCIEAACMEIPQRAMMQAIVLWLLLKWNLNLLSCILINALIWCGDIIFQAVVIQKQVSVKKPLIEVISSFVFSIGIGYVFLRCKMHHSSNGIAFIRKVCDKLSQKGKLQFFERVI